MFSVFFCLFLGMEVRLVPTSAHRSFEGRVEVARDGVWGTICSNAWSHYDAVVVCQQLGYASGQISSRVSGPQNAPVHLNNVGCDGTETSIFQCPSLGWGVDDEICNMHKKDAAVYCKPWGKYISLVT